MYQTNKGLVRNNTGTNHIYTRYQPDGSNNYKLTSSTVATWALSLGLNYETSLGGSVTNGGYTILSYKTSDTTIRALLNYSSVGSVIAATPSAGFLGVTRTSSALTVYSQNGTESNAAQASSALPASQLVLAGFYDYTKYRITTIPKYRKRNGIT